MDGLKGITSEFKYGLVQKKEMTFEPRNIIKSLLRKVHLTAVLIVIINCGNGRHGKERDLLKKN